MRERLASRQPPRPRKRGLVTQAVEEELLVYDTERDVICTLDRSMTALFRCCSADVARLEDLVDRIRREADPRATVAVVQAALDELEAASLLESKVSGREGRVAKTVGRVVRRSRFKEWRQDLSWPSNGRPPTRRSRGVVSGPESPRDILARVLRVDAIAVDIARSLEARGIRAVVLKGPAIACWLYDDRAERPYGDIDLIVSPADFAETEVVLDRYGFVSWYDGPAPERAAAHAVGWMRGFDLGFVSVDLHRTFWGVGVGGDAFWKAVTAQTERACVGGGELEIPAEPMRTLIVALHAAHHTDGAKAREDLRRALDRLGPEVWDETARLARELEAESALLNALLLSPPAGVEIIRRVGLEDSPGAVPGRVVPEIDPETAGYARLAAAEGSRAKLALIVHLIFPSPRFMRQWRALAHRGWIGLVSVYVWRPVWLILNVIPRFLAWRTSPRGRT
jgi:Uncharacterised nucleotidyltransferase